MQPAPAPHGYRVGVANSATLLADLVERWRLPANKTPEEHRGAGAHPSTQEFWTDHVLAVRWLNEIDDALIAMEAMGEETAHYRQSQPAWYAAVFAQSVPWGSRPTNKTQQRPIADRRDIALLRALGQQLESVGYAPRVAASDLESLRAAVNEAHDLIIETPLDDAVRRYLLGLVSEARACLDELAAFGSIRLRDVTFTLGGALNAAAETAVPPAHKQRWRDTARTVLAQIAVQGTAGALGTMGAHLLLPPGVG